jgi:hypothetical protein
MGVDTVTGLTRFKAILGQLQMRLKSEGLESIQTTLAQVSLGLGDFCPNVGALVGYQCTLIVRSSF